MANAETRDKLKRLKTENKLLKREIERLNARIETSRLKELKLLSDLIEAKGVPTEIKCRACGTRNQVRRA